ncbi:Cochaperone protein [Geranomyces variabilis]|uniref:Cochaperone protein n=1 Tax=Geranomyces variabilis TaxID=109894 RepID=A0AAD5TLY6_9FUNG|nr:Cochaperone protein [Geranomyces variabilis]
MTSDDDPSTLLVSANELFLDEQYAPARDLYTRVLAATPSTVDTLLKRATCNHNLAAFEAALADARAAIKVATTPVAAGKAHLRAGMAALELGKVQDATEAFVEAGRAGVPAADKWIEKCVARGGKVPAPPVPASSQQFESSPSQSSSAPTAPTLIPAAASFLPPSKIRHEWYQTDAFIIISVFIKNVDSSAATINFASRAISVSVKLPAAGSAYSLELDPLLHDIIPGESQFAVMKTKIEIKAKKAVAGIRWAELEGEEDAAVPAGKVVGVAASEDVKAYPSSSKKHTNWDAIAKETDDDKPEGEAALNALFQSIYKDATPDTRRAMMKSYVESSGTCLSTNWDEISQKKTEVTPPEGMVAKKFEM